MSPVITNNMLGLPGYEVVGCRGKRPVVLTLLFDRRPRVCPCCGADRLHSKGRYRREVRHRPAFGRSVVLQIQTRRYRCVHCTRSFVPELPGIRPWRQSSEPFRESLYEDHHEGLCASTLARRHGLGAATIARIYAQFTARKASERLTMHCPQILGIDEHTLHKGQRFATTFCDLKNHRVFDVVPGRSPQDLEAYVRALKGREQVRVICIDLSSPYRALIRRWFPRARIVADRFHAVRVIYQHILKLARAIAPEITRHRRLLACLRQPRERLSPSLQQRLQTLLQKYPALAPILQLREELCALLNQKTQTKRQCRRHAHRLLELIKALHDSGITQLQILAQTLQQWAEPIAAMWRFSKNNAITEGFHRKMKLIQRRAYGFRNFNNYRLRVIAQCG